MRHDRFADATRLMLAASPETMALQDTDEWWRERRVLARKLLDLGSSRPPIRSCATPPRRTIRTTAPNSISWPVGLRCAFSRIPPRHSRTLRMWTTVRPIPSYSRGPLTGAAAPMKPRAKPRTCERNYRGRRPLIRPPIMDSWRARGSGSATLNCARRPNLRAAPVSKSSVPPSFFTPLANANSSCPS